MSAPGLQAGIDEYLAYLRLERGLSPTTIASYRTDLTLFLAFLKRQGIGDAGRISTAHVRGFLQALREKSKRSPSTV
ncbi:MAG: site-specific integrase, partial [Dehalococcoidia bacterium]|nr:site-specific integrase [Dehalococcoidia bacterium]